MGGKIVRFPFPSFQFTCFSESVALSQPLFIFPIDSRPKQVKDVAHQDEVVRVLTNTLETASVLIIIDISLSLFFNGVCNNLCNSVLIFYSIVG